MTSADFTALKDHILQYNTCFDNGYANAFKYDETNTVLARGTSGDFVPVFPSDSLGNYFYLRSDGDIKYTAQPGERLTDNGTQRLTFLDTLTIQLVAIVKDADEYALIANLRNTAMAYKPISVIPIAASYNREFIIADEMRGMNKEDIAKALRNLTSQTIVRLALSVNKNYIPGNCIGNPCKNC